MLRILLTIILPIALPLLLYFGYVNLTRRAGEGILGPLEKGVWIWLISGGLALAIVLLVTWDMMTGVPPGTKLRAPYMDNGRIVPSQVIDQPK
jgi:hypothetical protein